MKCVYLIKSLEDGYYKVGVSKNPNKRLSQLQTGNSSELKLINRYKSDEYNLIESTIHRLYSHLKKEGEWFDFSIEEEVKFIDICKKIENNIKITKKTFDEF
jgi:hypothetical protein